MPPSRYTSKVCAWLGAGILAPVIPWSPLHAEKSIHESRPADPQGLVEIAAVSGSVEVSGWDRSEVEVSGTVGDKVERVEVTGAAHRTFIRVVPRPAWGWGADSEARLNIHVPVKSAVSATVVNAGLKLTGIQGELQLQTVSGNVSGDVGGDVRANTASGDVWITARSAKTVELNTISGSIHLLGGGGEVEITTVSGEATIELAALSRGRFKSVSGDVTASLGILAGGQIDGESVSGDFRLTFPSAPSADFDVQSVSGSINNCFGPKPAESRHGSGSRLQFKNGDDHARVRIKTKIGDVQLCVNRADGTDAAAERSKQHYGRRPIPYAL